jgi:hypothetical protein
MVHDLKNDQKKTLPFEEEDGFTSISVLTEKFKKEE